jgi:predicted membrane protein
MKQTKKQSLIESLTNTAVGFLISLAATFVIIPLVGYASTFSKNLIVTLFFTVVSIVRGYVIRRYFNKKV